MFSKELENLIQATLEDGRLEENEKAALVKRAQREGVDLDELDIYINSLLQRKQREQREKNDELDRKYEEEQKRAIGPVCPKCHKQVPPLTLKCDCGYEFTKSKSVSSVQLFFEKIENIQSSPIRNLDVNSDEYREEIRGREKRIIDTIEMFPVPNTKEDLIEFLSLAASNANKKVSFMNTRTGRTILYIIGAIVLAPVCFIGPLMAMTEWFPKLGTSEGVLQQMRQKVWRAKFDQVLMKGRSLRGDTEFQRQLDYYENLVSKK